jgi:hypothetical protein
MMKAQYVTRFLVPIVTVMAIATLGWQQSRMARAQVEINRLQSENARLPTLEEALADLQRIEIDQAELQRLRQAQASYQLELARARALAARTLRAEADAAALRIQLEQSSTPALVAADGIAAPMAQMTWGVLEQRNQRQLTRMQERLDLTPPQADAIGQILDRRAQGLAEAMKGIYSGKMDSAKIASLRDCIQDPESRILAFLTPDQQAAYAQMRDEERAETALRTANNQFLEMRSTLDLRADQEDSVFDVLHAQALQQQFASDFNELELANPAEAMQEVMQRKLEALESVLTNEQLARYQQQQELHLELLKGMMGRMQTATTQP